MDLTPVQLRILGAMVEKERTTPDTYPLSMNALLAACNQTTNRDPVVTLDERVVSNALENLKAGGLARVVYSRGMRVDKYRHVLTEAWQVSDGELAVLAVLMLRGPQTGAELRTRTERLHDFSGPAELDATLDGLARRQPPLVVLLPRQPGQKEPRWAHQLGTPEPHPHPAPATDADYLSDPAVTPENLSKTREARREIRQTGLRDDLGEVLARTAALERRLDELDKRLDELLGAGMGGGSAPDGAPGAVAPDEL